MTAKRSTPPKPALTKQQSDRIAQRQLREQGHPLAQPLGARQPRRTKQ